MYTIGELARLSGQPVRRIRFYSDEGLLPPAVRTDSNYRLYSEDDLARLDLIGALRDAGVGLDAIGRLLRTHGDVRDVLGTRLAILDAEIAAKQRTASVLRATLRLPHLDVDTMRRYWKMSRVNNEQMKALVAAFMERVTSGARSRLRAVVAGAVCRRGIAGTLPGIAGRAEGRCARGGGDPRLALAHRSGAGRCDKPLMA